MVDDVRKLARRGLTTAAAVAILVSLAVGNPLAGGHALQEASAAAARDGSGLDVPVRIVEDLHARGLVTDATLRTAHRLLDPDATLADRIATGRALAAEMQRDVERSGASLAPDEVRAVYGAAGDEARAGMADPGPIDCILECLQKFVTCVVNCLLSCDLTDPLACLNCILKCLSELIDCILACLTNPAAARLPGPMARAA